MPNNDRQISIRVSAEYEEDTEKDLLKAIYFFKRMQTFGKTRQTVHRQLKKLRKQRQYRKISEQPSPSFDRLYEIAHEHEIQINLWDQARGNQTPKLLKSISPSSEYRTMNLVAPYFLEAYEFKLAELHLILDFEKFIRKFTHQTQGNFWMCLEMSDMVGCESWEQIAQAWESENIDLAHEPRFVMFFGFGFSIFLSKRNKARQISFTRVHKTRLPQDNKSIFLEYLGESWPEDKTLITLDDQFVIRSEEYFRVLTCPNEFCDYNTNRVFNLERHVKTCSTDTYVGYKQTILSDRTARDWCIERGYINASYFPRNFATFDIESIGVDSSDCIGDATRLISVQRVISVSVTKSFAEGDNTKVFVRQSMSEEHYSSFIAEFLNHLIKIQEEYRSLIPQTAFDAISYLEEEIAAFKNKERNYSFQQVKSMTSGLQYLTRLQTLHVFGFNSQAYDLCVLFSGILLYAKKNKFTLSVIKNGNKIMSLRFKSIVFCDSLNFSPGCNLDSFGKMWGANSTKSCFPYELFKNIAELEETKLWPRLTDFRSSLSKKSSSINDDQLNSLYDYAKAEIDCTKETFVLMLRPNDSDEINYEDLSSLQFPICPETYVKMWVMYTQKRKEGTMSSMKDYLCYYNSLDTKVLAEGFQNYIDSFIKNFGITPLGFMTLPGLSERVMWKQYDRSQNQPYSFSAKFGFVNKLLRENLMGGLAAVLKRHVEVNTIPEIYSKTVHCAPNGKPFTQLVAYDANSE